MLHGRRDLSITARLLILAIAIVTPVILFSGVIALRYAEAERAGLAGRVGANLAALAANIDRELANAGHVAMLLAATSGPLQRGDIAGFDQQARRAATLQGIDIALVDEGGRQLANSAVAFGTPLPAIGDAARITAAFADGGAVVAGIIDSEPLRHPAVAIDIPIETASGDRYLLSLALDTKIFQQILAAEHLPDDWLVAILDGSGRVIARSRNAERFVGKPVLSAFWSRVRGPAGSFAHVTREGVPVEAVFRRLPGSAWVVAIATPLATLARPAWHILNLFAAAGAGILLVVAAVALWAGRQIAAPISALSLSAAALGRGDEPPLPPGGVREATEVGFALRTAYGRVIRRNEALRAGESRYRAIFETARDAIVVIDEAGHIGAFNRAAEAMTGYDAGEVVGRSIAMLLPPPAADGGAADNAEPLRPGEAPVIGAGREIEILRKDAQTLTVDLAIGEWVAAGRRHFTGILRDLTPRQRGEQLRGRLEDQLRQAQKMEAIGQLTGGIAHDFNNLLLAINLNLEILAEEMPAADGTAKLFDGAQQAVDQARALIRQLLAFARRQALNPTSFDVSQAIVETTPILRRTLPVTITIETVMGRNLWPAFADSNQFVTSLLNLAVNARDAMPEGGRMAIEAANVTLDDSHAAMHLGVIPGDYVRVAVSDVGCGMPAHIAERAFEPFFTTKGVRGTGLGLSQVYGYARQSGGYAAIESEPGSGAKVTLYLPRSRSPARLDDWPEPLLDPAGGETILLVEDTAVVRQAVARMLSDLGYRVVATANGPEALAVLDESVPIDLLFTDIVLPGGIAGDELATMARRRRPGLRVLYTSGYSEAAIAGAAAGGAAVDLLLKPYTKAELAGRLRRALRREMARA